MLVFNCEHADRLEEPSQVSVFQMFSTRSAQVTLFCVAGREAIAIDLNDVPNF